MAQQSKYRGVSWHVEFGLWEVTVQKNRLGWFEEEEDAARAYNCGVRRCFLRPVLNIIDVDNHAGATAAAAVIAGAGACAGAGVGAAAVAPTLAPMNAEAVAVVEDGAFKSDTAAGTAASSLGLAVAAALVMPGAFEFGAPHGRLVAAQPRACLPLLNISGDKTLPLPRVLSDHSINCHQVHWMAGALYTQCAQIINEMDPIMSARESGAAVGAHTGDMSKAEQLERMTMTLRTIDTMLRTTAAEAAAAAGEGAVGTGAGRAGAGEVVVARDRVGAGGGARATGTGLGHLLNSEAP